MRASRTTNWRAAVLSSILLLAAQAAIYQILMFNAVNFASLNFSTFSGTVVRGHALEYSSP